jgi:ATP-dependent RNA helicase RhlE
LVTTTYHLAIMPTEILTFEESKLNKQLLTAIAEAGYTVPTPIQQKAIPLILAGQDIFGIAQTGTGKTAAFLLPLLMKIKYAQGNNPRALILAPTRELAMQIDQHLAVLAKYTDLRHACVYGGTGMKAQIEAVSKGIDILTATPGRFMDIYLAGHLPSKEIRTLILDEADRMMDMGFMPQIRRILEILPQKRQNLLFSATMPEKVIKLSAEFLEYALHVEVAPQATPVETVTQGVYKVPNLRTKINLLAHLLADKDEFRKVIIFAKTKHDAENVYKFIERKITKSVKVIHANKGQNTRINSMEEFKNNDIRLLVATDVAARGIDVSMVSHVINFDVPNLYDDYVHRIGRTGRAKNLGNALTFCTMADEYHIKKIEQLIQMQIPVLALPPAVEVLPTPKEEEIEMLREIDRQKRKENPDFLGAFHETKAQIKEKELKQQQYKARRPKKGRMIE